MLKKLVLITIFSSALPVVAQPPWTADYVFPCGIRVSRTPQGVSLEGEREGIFSVGKGFQLAPGGPMNEVRPTCTVNLLTALTPINFERELCKLGLGTPTRVTQFK